MFLLADAKRRSERPRNACKKFRPLAFFMLLMLAPTAMATHRGFGLPGESASACDDGSAGADSQSRQICLLVCTVQPTITPYNTSHLIAFGRRNCMTRRARRCFAPGQEFSSGAPPCPQPAFAEGMRRLLGHPSVPVKGKGALMGPAAAGGVATPGGGGNGAARAAAASNTPAAAVATAAPQSESLHRAIKTHNGLTHTLTVGLCLFVLVGLLVALGVGGKGRSNIGAPRVLPGGIQETSLLLQTGPPPSFKPPGSFVLSSRPGVSLPLPNNQSRGPSGRAPAPFNPPRLVAGGMMPPAPPPLRRPT